MLTLRSLLKIKIKEVRMVSFSEGNGGLSAGVEETVVSARNRKRGKGKDLWLAVNGKLSTDDTEYFRKQSLVCGHALRRQILPCYPLRIDMCRNDSGATGELCDASC